MAYADGPWRGLTRRAKQGHNAIIPKLPCTPLPSLLAGEGGAGKRNNVKTSALECIGECSKSANTGAGGKRAAGAARSKGGY